MLLIKQFYPYNEIVMTKTKPWADMMGIFEVKSSIFGNCQKLIPFYKDFLQAIPLSYFIFEIVNIFTGDLRDNFYVE